MSPVIEALLVLQDRDRRLLRLRAEIEALPHQRKVLEERSATAQAAFDSIRHRAQQFESDRKKLELEVDSLKQRISKVAAEQQSTRSNDQYKAFQHQIETIQTEISRMDDQQLVLMEQAESANAGVKIAQQTANVQKAESEKQLQELVVREASLRQELASVIADRARVAGSHGPHPSRTAAIGGRLSDTTLQWSPPSKLVHSPPVVLPISNVWPSPPTARPWR